MTQKKMHAIAAAFMCAALAAAPAHAEATAPQPGIPATQLIPQPQSLTLAAGKAPFALAHDVHIVAPPSLAQPAGLLATTLNLRLAGTRPGKTPPSAKAIRFVVAPMAGAVAGAYRLQVRDSAITIHAAEASGAFNATQTLLQMLPPGDAARRTPAAAPLSIPALDIADAPRFEWRGLTLDLARHFFSADALKNVIDSMAAYKMNRLHLHLTDDTGWRIPIRSYPKLTSIGAQGDRTNPQGPVRFYTREEIRFLVRYAAERQIEIVPEIEMPGHGGAAARAYPEFFDGGNTWNPANPETYRFIDAVLGEVAELFPGRYLHFGGDEVNPGGWSKLPAVVAMARALDPSSDQPNFKAVEAEFARRVVAIIRKHNRTPMGWDEIISAGLNENTIVQWWRLDKPEVLRKALDQKKLVVLSPADRMYLDYPQGLGESGAPWEGNTGGPMSIEKIAAWEPTNYGLSAEQQSRIVGIEAALWTEFVRSEPYFEYMLYPRLGAVAEVAWRMQPHSTPAAFAERLEAHILRWKALGRTVRGGWDDIDRFRVQ